jgi:hypothetical protein
MKNATSLEEKQFYFNLAFNAAREEAGQQFVQAALTAAGVISAISTAGVSLAAATSFGRQAALLGRGALLKGSIYAGRIASSIEAASLRGGMAVQNTIMRSATHLRTLSNITGRMLYPKGLSFDTMLLMGASDLSFQFGSKFAYNYFYWGKNWKESGIDAIQKEDNIYKPTAKYKDLFILDKYQGKIKGIKFKNEFISWIEKHIKEDRKPQQASLF